MILTNNKARLTAYDMILANNKARLTPYDSR